jgi:protein phosphatase
MNDGSTQELRVAERDLPAGDPRGAAGSQATDVGRVRSVNQDSCDDIAHATQPMRLVVTADGMGGHRAGELASRLVVEASGEVFQAAGEPSGGLLRAALEAANARIRQVARERPEAAGMGSTGAALLLADRGRAWAANVGDSRVYRLRGGRLVQLTRDHSLVAELVEAGALKQEDARGHPRRNELRRALGVRENVEIDLFELSVEPGDRYLVCSDGLWSVVPDDEIGQVLSRETPEEATRILVERANQGGGSDNITVQVIAIAGAEPAPFAAVEARSPAPPPRPAAAVGPAPRAQPRLALVALLAAALAGLLAWLLVTRSS